MRRRRRGEREREREMYRRTLGRRGARMLRFKKGKRY